MIPASPTAYIYVRWSSERQNEKESTERQLKACRTFAKTLGLPIKEMKDKGTSAFSGSHRSKGELGAFLLRAQAGTVPKGSWLICENLDRLSRENPQEAQYWLLTILRAGIHIHTTMDNHTYTPHERNASMHLMRALFSQDLAHEESQKKSNRTLSAAHNAILRNLGGDKYLACTAAAKPPWWITRRQQGRAYYNELKEDCAGLVKIMIDLTFEGMGSERIAQYLNKNHLPRPTGLSKEWKSSFVSKTLANPAIYGEANISLKETDTHPARDYLIPDYYPEIVSKARFYKMRALKKQAKCSKRKEEHVSLFGGMNILKCSLCGGSMYHNRQGGGVKRRYMCITGQQGGLCKPWSFTADWVEDALLRLCNNQIIEPRVDNSNQRAKEEIEMQLVQLKEEQNSLVELSVMAGDIEAIADKMKETQVKIQQLKANLHDVEVRIFSDSMESQSWKNLDDRIVDPNEHDLRREIRPRIADSVERIECTQVSRGHVKFKITFKNQIVVNCEREKNTFRFMRDEWGDLSGAPIDGQERADFLALHSHHVTNYGVDTKHRPLYVNVGLNTPRGVIYAPGRITSYPNSKFRPTKTDKDVEGPDEDDAFTFKKR